MAEPRLLAEEPELRHTMRRAWPHMRSRRWLIAGALTASLVSTASVALIPAAVGVAVDALLDRNESRVWWAVAAVIALAVARLILYRASALLLAKAGEYVIRDLRELAVHRIAAAPLRFMEAHRRGDLLRRLTSEVADLADFVRSQLPLAAATSTYLVFTTVMLLIYSAPLTLLLFAVFVPAFLGISFLFERVADRAFGAEAATAATVAATYRESVEAAELVQINGGTEAWVDRFDRDNQAFQKAVRGREIALLRLSLTTLGQGLTTATLLVAGGWLVTKDQISVGTVVVFILATRDLFGSADQVAGLIGQLKMTRVGLGRLLDLLEATEPAADDQTAAGTPRRGDLELSGIRYSYGGERFVLDGVDLHLPAGDRIALVGPTGAGKTTLAKVLCGLYLPDEGAVRYAGTDLTDLTAPERRARLVLVPQQVHLVTGTIADNLRLVPTSPTDADLHAAVTAVGLADWVAGLPDGLETDVGPEGGRLSNGERQLLGLIRAALVDPAVLVLDEATADVDPQTAARVEAAVDALSADRTLIVIAHRPETVARLPRALEVVDGRVRERNPSLIGKEGLA